MSVIRYSFKDFAVLETRTALRICSPKRKNSLFLVWYITVGMRIDYWFRLKTCGRLVFTVVGHWRGYAITADHWDLTIFEGLNLCAHPSSYSSPPPHLWITPNRGAFNTHYLFHQPSSLEFGLPNSFSKYFFSFNRLSPKEMISQETILLGCTHTISCSSVKLSCHPRPWRIMM